MKIEIAKEIVEGERVGLDNTLAEYERVNTRETGIAETMDIYARDVLLALFLLPVLILRAVLRLPIANSAGRVDKK